jgi:hypothetical protein
MTLTLEVALTIPDNEALTAFTTLRRLGVEVGSVERADVWRFGVDPGSAEALVAAVRVTETIFNPNKHRLRQRDDGLPGQGEVWIDEVAASIRGDRPFRFAGRDLPGVSRLERFVAWRLFDREGSPAPRSVVDSAVETLLCNPAFQRAIR